MALEKQFEEKYDEEDMGKIAEKALRKQKIYAEQDALETLKELEVEESVAQEVVEDYNSELKKDLGYEIIKTQENEHSRGKETKNKLRNIYQNVLGCVFSGIILTGLIGSFSFGIERHFAESEEYTKLKKEMYEIADTNNNHIMEYEEYLKLAKQFEEITEKSYIPVAVADSREEIIGKIKQNIHNTPERNKVLKNFIEKYGTENPNL